MRELTYTLLSDGSSDQVLLPVITWLIRQADVPFVLQPEWADLRRLPIKAKNLREKIQQAIDLYPCDLLFVHRDAEREERQHRIDEINNALEGIDHPPVVCVVPVRMQEAWFLFDETAIRSAAGNPNGENALELPPISSLEQLPDPKRILHNLILEASSLPTHRRRKFNVPVSVHRIPLYINDFSPLRVLESFSVLENDIRYVINENILNR